MKRLSPQDLDREINEELDKDPLQVFTVGAQAPLPSRGRMPAVEGAPPPLRNNRHGWQPTLDNIERR